MGKKQFFADRDRRTDNPPSVTSLGLLLPMLSLLGRNKAAAHWRRRVPGCVM